MIRTTDTSSSVKRIAGKPGDRQPSTMGFYSKKEVYTATGGETSITLKTFTYYPTQNQISVKRSSGSGELNLAAGDYFETSSTTVGFPVSDPLVAGEIVEIIQ